MATKQLLRVGIVFTLIMIISPITLGQSGQYKRPTKKAEKQTEGAIQTANAPADKAAADKVEKKDDKVNINEIEQQYWTPKDTEFKVVQNRRYTKEKRFYGSASLGFLIADENNSGNTYNLGVGYYFKEQYGVELMYSKYDVKSNEANLELKNRGGFFNQNWPVDYYGAAFHWVPIYAKMSLLDWEIIYFDMAFSPSIGMTNATQLSDEGNHNVGPYFTFGLDVSQHFFLSEHFAIKIDYRNRFYTEEIIRYYVPAGSPNVPVSTGKTLSTFTFGVEYFY